MLRLVWFRVFMVGFGLQCLWLGLFYSLGLVSSVYSLGLVSSVNDLSFV